MNLKLQTIPCDPDRLESFLSGELSDAEERELTLHLNTCEHCRRTLEQQAAEPGAWHEAENLLKPLGFDSPAIDENSNSGVLKGPTRQPLQIQSVLDALRPTDDPEMLGRLGGYEVSGVVGAGGMGVVLKAIDRSLDRTVAIKVMAPHLASSGAARKRFAREAKAAAAVLHPNVIAIHSVSNDESLPYLVMPYMRGTSLQKRLDREGPLSLNEILRIGSQIAAGLAAAHAQGLVHRDIKPANILLEDGVERVTITDFGLARAVDDATITHSGVIAGTPQYMSPEQARGEAVEQRSDLFSLGSVLYALCSGRAPFRAESTYGVLRRIIDEEPKPIRELNPEIPEWLCRIIARLMSKQPDNRFESAQAVAELLEKCLAHVQQPTAVPLPASVETQSNGRRSVLNSPRRRIFAMVAAFGLTLLGMIFWQASAPPDISGQWTGAEWGNVFLEEKQSGEYAGTYTDTFGGKPGTMQMKWSRLEHRFNGTWQEGNDRNGKISVRLADGQIRGAWGTSKESEINAGIPDMADLLWVRQEESETAIAGFVVAVSNAGTVRISIGHDDGLKIGMRLGVFHEGERRGTLEVRMIGADSSTAVMIEINKPEIPIQRGDKVVGTIPAATTTPLTLEADKRGKVSGVEAPQRRLEVCAASELSANEAAVLEKSNAVREILYLNSSDGKVILLRRNHETLLDETDLVSAAATPDPDLQDSYSVNLELSAEAAKRFGRETLRLSTQNTSVRLAVLVPGKVLMAPYLRSAIPDGKIRITGNFTKQEAERLAAELNGAEDSPSDGSPPATSQPNAADVPPKRIHHFADLTKGNNVRIAYSTDGKLIALANGNPTLIMHGNRTSSPADDWKPSVDLLDAETGKVVVSLELTTADEDAVLAATERISHIEATALAFSPDGRVLAVGTNIGQVKLFNTQTGELVRSLDDEASKLADQETPEHWKPLRRAMGSVVSLRFSPDGSLLAMCGGSFADFAEGFSEVSRLGSRSTFPGRLKLWDVETGTLKHDLVGHNDQAYVVAFSPDGQFLASAGRWHGKGERFGKGGILWDARTGEAIHNLLRTDANVGVLSIAFSPDSRMLALGTQRFGDSEGEGDKEKSTGGVSLVRVSSGEEWRRTVPGWATPIAFSADGKSVAVLCGGRSIRFLGTATGTMLREIKPHESQKNMHWDDFAISPKTHMLVIGGVDKDQNASLEVWDASADGTGTRTENAPTSPATRLEKDGKDEDSTE